MKKLNWKRGIAAIVMAAMLIPALVGCTGNKAETETLDVDVPSENTETEITTDAETDTETKAAEEEVVQGPKEVVVYFANWYLEDKKGMEGGEVASIPWEQVTYINHAFWGITPDDGTKDTSFERREKEEEPRTQFKIVSANPEMDYMDETPSEADSSMPRNHFAEYEVYSQQYPDVNIMISIGGWTKCGYFSEMAYTPEGRESFIASCLELMDQYTWIDGIDIDWEYPAGSRDGERLPEDETDEGCPIWGTPQEDNANFALLLKELREAMTAKYGEGVKKLTACASASYGWTLPCQDWVAAEPYVDLINIMTYDFAGTWAGVTGHSSSINDTKGAVFFFKDKISYNKLCIGSPMFAMDLKIMKVGAGPVLGASIEPIRPSSPIEVTQTMLDEFKQQAVSGYTIKEEDGRKVMDGEFTSEETGWHMVYDASKEAPYMYNDDEDSEYYGWFLSYEDELSLQAKLDFIEKMDLAGIIVWECSQDTVDHRLITQMGDRLLEK